MFPQAFYPGCGLTIERVEYANIRVRRHFQEGYIRPGGTISGPTMMELADFAMYVAVFSAVGPQPLAVTTNLNINFLRKPGKGDLIAEARLMKVGKRLGGRRGRNLFGRPFRAGGPCNVDLFDPAGSLISHGTKIPFL